MQLQSLRKRIGLVFLSVALIVFLLASLLSGLKKYTTVKAHYAKIMQSRLHVAASLINNTIVQHNNIITATIANSEAQTPEQLFKTLATFHHLLLPANIFYILDSNGKVIHIPAPYSEYKGLNFSAIINDGGNMKNKSPSPYQSLLTKKSVIITHHPLDNGYLLVVEIPLDIFPPIMSSFANGKFDYEEIFFVLTDHGRVIYHSDHTLMETRHNFGFEMGRQSIEDENGLFNFTSQGNNFISKSKQFENLPGWSIYYALPEPVITRAIINEIIDQTVFLSILFVFLLAALLIAFNRYFTMPATRLVEALSSSKPGKSIYLPDRDYAGIKEFHTIATAIKDRDTEIINSFKRFKTILNSMDAIIYVACIKTNEIIFINNSCKNIYGDCIGLTCSKCLCSKSESPCDLCSSHFLIDANGTPTGTHTHEIKDSSTGQWLERRTQAILWPDGRMVRLQVATNINNRKEAEESLSMEKERLAVTLRSIGDAVITTDTDGKVTMINRIAEELTGWNNDDALGETSTKIFNIINEKTGQKCVSPVQRVMELGRIVGLANHTALIARNGTIYPIADSGAPIRDRESKIIGVVVVFRDVTHERKMEEELLKIKKLESVGVLAGGIAHDFNNILTAILGNIDLIGYHINADDEKTVSLLANANKAARRAIKLTGQLLTFAKGGEPIRETASLPGLIRDSADFVLHGSQVICRYELPGNLWMVDADIGQISQVVQNIVINSKHAMPEGGTIIISCANIEDAANEALLSMDNGNFVRITIKDTGVGIPREIIDKIFDPYFTTKQEGSGLGLAICHSIINKHDGHLLVDSSPGKGTVFTIYLPAILSTGIPANKKQFARQKAMKSARIMVMDDDRMIRDVTSAQLHTLGHDPVPTKDGKETINKYQALQDEKNPVDIVIMDLTIPGGMGGLEAVGKLLEVDPLAKVIVASGYSNDPVMADYKKYGFSAAIGKPFSLDELARVIESVLA